MLFSLFLSSAFAGPMAACSVSNFPAQVARVWYLADHGPYLHNSVVRVGTDIPSEIVPGAIVTYEIMGFENHLAMAAWYQLPATVALPVHPGPTLAINILMKRDGTIINTTDAKACEGKRSLAADFFNQLHRLDIP